MIAADGRPKRRRHTLKAHQPKGFRSPPIDARARRALHAAGSLSPLRALSMSLTIRGGGRRCPARDGSSRLCVLLASPAHARPPRKARASASPRPRARGASHTRPTWTRSQFRGRHWMRWIDIRLLCRAWCVCVLSWCCVGIDKVRHPIDGCHILLRAASRCACAGTTDQRVAMPTAAALSATLIVAALEQRVPTTLQDGSTGR